MTLKSPTRPPESRSASFSALTMLFDCSARGPCSGRLEKIVSVSPGTVPAAALLLAAAGGGHEHRGAGGGQQGFQQEVRQHSRDPGRRDSNAGSQRPATAASRSPTVYLYCADEDRRPHRRRRLPRPERGDPGGHAQGDRRGPRGGRPVARLRRPRRAQLRAARHARGVGDPAARGHDPVHLELRPVPARGRRRSAWSRRSSRTASTPSWRSAASTRWASPAGCTRSTGSRWSACRRRSTTTSPAPTTRSASTPPCRSRPTRSTACTRRRSRTTA